MDNKMPLPPLSRMRQAVENDEPVGWGELKRWLGYLLDMADTRDPEQYRHYKGDLYKLLMSGKYEATGKPCVIYQGEDVQVWVRDEDLFFGQVEVDGQMKDRFAKEDEANE